MFMVLNHRLNTDLEARKVVQQVRKVTLMKWSFNLMILDLKFGLRREVRERVVRERKSFKWKLNPL